MTIYASLSEEVSYEDYLEDLYVFLRNLELRRKRDGQRRPANAHEGFCTHELQNVLEEESPKRERDFVALVMAEIEREQIAAGKVQLH